MVRITHVWVSRTHLRSWRTHLWTGGPHLCPWRTHLWSGGPIYDPGGPIYGKEDPFMLRRTHL